MMKEEAYLGLWRVRVTQNGEKSDSISYGTLCRAIGELSPDDIAYKVVERLDASGYVRMLPDGRRELSPLGIEKRIPLPSRPRPTNNVGDEKAWVKFRSLCDYYADCIRYSERSQEYLFHDKLNITYMLPCLEIGWFDNDQKMELRFDANKQAAAVNSIDRRSQDGEDVCIGYPLRAFKGTRGEIVYSPIILVPVKMTYENKQYY